MKRARVEITEFLMARIEDNEASSAASAGGPALSVTVAGASEQIRRHRTRSMTVTSRSGIEMLIRCDVCQRQPSYPCNVLKLMASTYESHADFDPSWAITHIVTA